MNRQYLRHYWITTVVLVCLWTPYHLRATAQPLTETPARELLDRTIAALSSTSPDDMSSLFRYFEEQADQQAVMRDQKLVRFWFASFAELVGQYRSLEPSSTTTSPYVNVFVESATAGLWRRSTCIYRTHALAGELTSHGKVRRVEVLLELCFDQKAKVAWVKRVDVHIPHPDPDLIQRIARFHRGLEAEARRP